MPAVLIAHGTGGHPQENWFPWLKGELEKLGCQVFVPEFPTPENQTLENWMHVFEEYEQNLDENSLIVGHSLGVPFLLNVLEKLEKPIKASFFVAGFTGSLGIPLDEINNLIADRIFGWGKIKQNCKKFHVFHSDNDPFVPLEKAEELAKNLGVEVILVKEAGHFNEESGYTKFELLLEKIKGQL